MASTRYGSLSRRVLVWFAAAVATVVWAHGLGALFRHLGPAQSPPAGHVFTLAALLLAVCCTAFASRLRGLALGAAGLAAGGLAVIVLEMMRPGSWSTGLGLVLSGSLVAPGSRFLYERLPQSLSGIERRRPLASLAWTLVAVLALVQLARLTTFMSDREFDWFVTTRHSWWAEHECLNAYVHGAELNERGEPNVYLADHYIGLNREAQPQTRFEMVAEDPYQYPPPFLLLPRLVIALTGDYATIRVVWYSVQVTGVLLIAAWLAVWVGGRSGRIALLLLPLLASAFTTLSALQYGQFHLAAIVLAVAGMILFESRRPAAGGFLLAFATIAKIFPGLLLLWLGVNRRWKEAGWTIAWALALTMVGWILLGDEPYTAFMHYQLPRLSSGEAFAFEDAWPEFGTFLVGINQGPWGIVRKLRLLGIPGTSETIAMAVGRTYGFLVLLAVVFATPRCRTDRATAWLAILGLGSLLGAAAFGDYGTFPAIWLLTLLSAGMTRNRQLLYILGTIWIFEYFLVGLMPMGAWYPERPMIGLSLVTALLLIVLYFWTLIGRGLADDGGGLVEAKEGTAC